MSTHDAARAVADLSRGTILATVEIKSAPERVFRAITTEEVTRWWGSAETYRTTEWTADLRPGGAWRAAGKGSDGNPFVVGGEFVEIDPPRRLVMTWRADWDAGNVTRVTYQLEPTGSGTRLTLWHEGFAGRPQACQGHTVGWELVLGFLAGYLAGAPAPRHYFVRLLPPRPSFLADMTPEEAAMMKEHGAYWRELLGRGAAVVFGPVLDPEGAWGLGVLAAADEAALHTLRDGDPAIRSGRGFRYEILPMHAAVY